MPRDHHRLSTNIWDEPNFRALTRLRQQAYLLVVSQPDLSRCGVLAYRPRRWAKTSSDGTEKTIRRDCQSLVSTRHLIIDEETEEAFGRTYVRHDHILAQPNMVAALIADYQLIASSTIRLAFLTEMRRLWSLSDLPDGERAGWLLAMGQYPAAAKPGDKGDWPNTMTPVALARISKAVRTGLRDQLVSAIRAGQVPGFVEASPEGIPGPFIGAFTEGIGEPFTEPSPEPPRAHTRVGTPAPAPGPLSPTPSPTPTSGGDGLAPLAGTTTTCQQLIAEWIDHTPKRPPNAVIGQVGKQLTAMLVEGQDPDDLRRALAAWSAKGLHPSTLPSVVHEVANSSRTNGAQPSTTDAKVQASIRRRDELRAQEHAS